MNVKFWLGSYLSILREIQTIQLSIEKVRSEQLGKAISYSGQPKSSDMHDLSNYIVRLERLEKRLQDRILKSMKRLEDIEGAIESLEDERERTILRLHFICEKSFEEIAAGMMYSNGHTYRLYKNAIKHVSECEIYKCYYSNV